VACRDPHDGGLGLRFDLCADGTVTAKFFCASKYQGYPDRMHGGIIATLLDAAMTHCLFAHNTKGVTAKLEVRYIRPVLIGTDVTISAAVISDRGMLVELEAELRQNGERCASAKSKFFVEKPLAACSG
jgi:uncharacterized protein (TIGR00369 family)